MAKKSKIAKNEQRKVIVERYAAKRAELKKTLVDENASPEAREEARLGLQKLPRDASPIRVRNRDEGGAVFEIEFPASRIVDLRETPA